MELREFGYSMLFKCFNGIHWFYARVKNQLARRVSMGKVHPMMEDHGTVMEADQVRKDLFWSQ